MTTTQTATSLGESMFLVDHSSHHVTREPSGHLWCSTCGTLHGGAR